MKYQKCMLVFPILASINASCSYMNKPLGAAFLHETHVNFVIENCDRIFARFIFIYGGQEQKFKVRSK